MSKMFVYYSKTKSEFISAGLPATYTNHIVFIKGDASGNGSCIYTHGMYFANFAEFLAAINYVKGISVNGTSYNAAQGGGYVAFNASDPATIAVNAGSNGIEIGLTTAFVNKVNDTATNLGSKTDAADKNGSAFARIANLAALVSDLTGGSTDSIEGQINNAINALREEIVGDLSGDEENSKTLEEINAELDGIDSEINDIRTTFATTQNLEDSVALVQGKSTDASTATTIYGAKKYAEEKAAAVNTALEPRVKANEDAIAVLNGNDATTGSVDKKIKDAINDFATKVSNDQTVNTFKELIDYAAEHGSEFSELVGEVEANTSAIETLNGNNTVAGSVDKKVKDAIDAEVSRADGAYATKAQGTKADNALQASDIATGGTNGTISVKGTNVPVKGLGSAAYTNSDAYATKAQGGKADTAYQKPTTGIPKTDLASAVQSSLDKAEAAAPQSTTYTKAEVNAMWEWEEL